MISEYTQFDKLKEIVRQGTCSRTGWAGVRARDCEHAIGLPGKHDGPETEDIYGKPSGWCWSCWKSHQIGKLQFEVQAVDAWQELAVESNRNVLAYLKGKFPSLELDGGMPIDRIRKVLDHVETLGLSGPEIVRAEAESTMDEKRLSFARDQLDEARFRKRPISKDTAAEKLAHAHYRTDSGILAIYRVLDKEGEKEQNAIKLLEVSENTTSDGIIPIFFDRGGLVVDPDYSAVIMEVTPEEFDDIKLERLPLPNGWRIGQEIKRCPAEESLVNSADLDFRDHNLKAVQPEHEPIRRKVSLTEQALEKLSGDLSHDNIAAAKQILKKIIGERNGKRPYSRERV